MNTTTDQIQSELRRIEREHGVRALFAVESGSRAWGFASRDSDYDVHFIYAHDREWYLAVDPQRDVIETSTAGGLDLSGWDLRKALKLLRKSNPSLMEWIKSPIVYRADPVFALLFGLLASEFHSPERSFRHYLHMAQGNHRAHLRGERVRLKKYLYVLRPLLACRWIERGLGPVPMKFQILADAVIEEANLRFHIAVLVARKRAGEELDAAQKIPAISAFVEQELERLEKIVPAETVAPETGKLDAFFREFCFAEAA
ncbi:MAG: nucleotidyltransferase domain-containing protein [Terrimicrobiaceae bacterium]|nr:nucleotidyltransferase domain-containing protein [Terrimicrobiaceae bacterium]